MTGALRFRLGAALASVLICTTLLLGAAAFPETWRERVLDALLAAAAPLRTAPAPLIAAPIVVVEIDRPSVEALGAWPWRRATIARLVTAIARTKPRAIGMDILFEGPETRSPAALARRLAAETQRPDLAAWADTLADDDLALATALALAPVALGYAMDPDGSKPAPDAAFHVEGAAPARKDVARARCDVAGARAGRRRGRFWRGALARRRGRGRASRARARHRRRTRSSRALRWRRCGSRSPSPSTSCRRPADGLTFKFGGRSLQLPADGMIRLAPYPPANLTLRSAASVLAGTGPPLPEGAMVLVGASVPESGALRASAADPLVASTRLQAAALAELRDARPPRPLLALDRATPLLAVALAATTLTAGLALTPAASLATLAALVGALWAGALVAAANSALWDPTLPSLTAMGAGLPPTLMTAAAAYRRERLIRRRFEQHLAPAVVKRIAADPGAVRLAGERREATALFTDIEGFTELTTRVAPAKLVRLLDGYFEGVVRIVHARGGMIDKFVGDAVHAFFNLPLDQADHVGQAIRCAAEIVAWSEAFRRAPDVAPHRFGRTRVGVECGVVIAGEVGAGARLDYTAYGEAVNLASRLEGANKRLGTAICVGPTAAARAPAGLLRPTGRLSIAGLQDEIETFGPWPGGADDEWRRAYLEAWAALRRGDRSAHEDFARLGEGVEGDPVAQRLSASS